MPNMQLLAYQGRTLSEQQMQEHGTLYRRSHALTPSASGGQATVPDAGIPVWLRISSMTAELNGSATMQAKTPEAMIRVPIGTCLDEGDRIEMDDGRMLEVVETMVLGTFDVDEKALVNHIN